LEARGRDCFRERSGSKRSPFASTRLSAAAESYERDAGSRFRAQVATSSQVTGVETVGVSFARRE
jgi:hypothetical protein